MEIDGRTSLPAVRFVYRKAASFRPRIERSRTGYRVAPPLDGDARICIHKDFQGRLTKVAGKLADGRLQS